MSKKYKTKVKKYMVKSDNELNREDIFNKIKIDLEKEKKHKKNKKRLILIIILELLLVISLLVRVTSLTYTKKELLEEIEKKEQIEKEKAEEKIYLFLGDSITNQYKLNKFYPKLKTINSGINGNETKHILEDLNNRVYQHNPTDVILLIGINQIQSDSVEKIFNDTIKIINKIKEYDKNITVYIESIYPVNKEIEGSLAIHKDNQKIKELNSKLKVYAEKNNIPYIDVYDDLTNEEGNLKEEYTKDGLHINDDAYKVITKKIQKIIKTTKEV